MSDNFPNLLETFNAAALAVAEETLPLQVFVNHYLTAMRHGTTDADEKHSLTKTIFDVTRKKLDFLASAAGIHKLRSADIKAELTPLLDALCKADCLDFLPRDAALQLATVNFKASETAAKMTHNNFSKWEHLESYRTQMAALTGLTLEYADIISQPRPGDSVETSKDIAPVKRITLKPAEVNQP